VSSATDKSSNDEPSNGEKRTVFDDPARRLIFRYHDGVRERLGDPIAITRQLLFESSAEFDADLAILEAGAGMVSAEQRYFAIGRVAEAARKAFDIPLLRSTEDGSVEGMTEQELLTEVLTPFVRFLSELKKNGAS
jgi:hypothetical protein